jgi:hypothetical protein
MPELTDEPTKGNRLGTRRNPVRRESFLFLRGGKLHRKIEIHGYRGRDGNIVSLHHILNASPIPSSEGL